MLKDTQTQGQETWGSLLVTHNNISQSINIFALVPRTPFPTRQGEKGQLTPAQAVGCVTQEET